MKVGFTYDPIYLRHDTGHHVENAKRLEAIVSYLEESQLKQQLILIEPRAASVGELSLVHQKEHIYHIQEVAQRGGGWLDVDTVMSANSYEVALYAVGGLIKAAEAVLEGRVDNAFALVRPPGHHATSRRAMGFCLFNNVAIATKYALAKYNLEHIAIIDFDVHHGNGTQDTFYDNPEVLYISTHQYPFYPGTGNVGETGSGKAEGTTVNIPLPAGCADAEYLQVFEQVIVPVVNRFKPQLIFVSAGYDPHWMDELALMEVSTTGFAQMVKIIKELADDLCSGHFVFTLEGGYNLNALATSVKATFDVLLGNIFEDPLGQPPHRFAVPNIDNLVKTIREVHNLL